MSAPHVTVTRSFQFCAGHRLFRPDWSEERNREVFGPCSNPEGHGHNYTLEVSVSGPIDRDTGMVMNLRQLKAVVSDGVLNDVDHKNLNRDVSWMAGIVPTTELFADKLWSRIDGLLRREAPAVHLERLVLQETPNNKVDLRR